jgi:hypothetical protein
MIVVFSEESSQKYTVNSRETQSITEAARMFGCRVYSIPANFDECGTAENALAYVPEFEQPITAVWVGVIPTVDRYQAIYDAALGKNILLVNSPEQHHTAMEFDHFYPLLEGITPKSIIIEDLNRLDEVLERLTFPMFVKGAVKSNKDGGIGSVIAKNANELRILAKKTLANPHRSRGKVIVREMVNFKPVAVDPNGFPIGREYRAFLYRGEVLAYGFYWDEYTDLQDLTPEEKRACLKLVKEAAKRVNVPYLSVDVGQLISGEWAIIEVGDGQFSGLSQIGIFELWNKVKDFAPQPT